MTDKSRSDPRAADAEVARLTAELEQARKIAVRRGSEITSIRAALAQARALLDRIASTTWEGLDGGCDRAYEMRAIARAALSPESTPPAQPAGQPSGNGE